MDERQLQWIAQNRRWRSGSEPLAAILRRERARGPLKVAPWRARIAGTLAEATDGTFTDHAWLGSLRSGVLTVLVDDPAMVGVLRMRWHRALLDLLGRCLPDLGIVDIRFRLGVAPPGPLAPALTDGAGALRAEPEQQ